MSTDLIRYDLLVQDALRSVVRKVLADAARTGLPGEHHFNIAFKTQAPGVVVPAAIRQRFPDEMSIILQHEFWDLVVTQDAFEVSLNFSRKPERLTVPFDAITGFTDPSVPFGFKLEPRAARSRRSLQPRPTPAPAPRPEAAAGAGAPKPAAGRPAPSAPAPSRPKRRRRKSRPEPPAKPKSFRSTRSARNSAGDGRSRQSAPGAQAPGARARRSRRRRKPRRFRHDQGRAPHDRGRARRRPSARLDAPPDRPPR